MRCPKCDYDNIEGAAYCMWCKKALPTSAVTPAEAARQAPVETAPAAGSPATPAPAPSAGRSYFGACIGACFALFGNGVFAFIWKHQLSNMFVSFLIGTSIVVGLVGFYFGLKIAARPTYGRGLLFGLSGGALIGAINGTGAFPVIGTVIGAVIGVILGAICGSILVSIVRSFTHMKPNEMP